MVTIEPIKNDKKKDSVPEATSAGVEPAPKESEDKKEQTDSDKALEASERAAHVDELIKSQKYRLPIKK